MGKQLWFMLTNCCHHFGNYPITKIILMIKVSSNGSHFHTCIYVTYPINITVTDQLATVSLAFVKLCAHKSAARITVLLITTFQIYLIADNSL